MGTVSNDVANDSLGAIVTRCGAAGKLKIRTSADADLVVMNMPNPIGVVAARTLTLDFEPDITQAATATGTAAKFVLTDSGDNIHYTGDAGTSGTELILDSVSITSGQDVTIQSGVITQ